MRLALNHIVSPRQPAAAFFAMARRLGVDEVEVRHGLTGAPLVDALPAAELRRIAEGEGVHILAVNALYPFNCLDDTIAARAVALADYAADAGAAGIAMYPRNDGTAVAHSRVVAALESLAPVLRDRGLRGHLEPLGLPGSSLRTKGEAIAAIEEAGGWDVFDLLHDTFHHYLADEDELYPRRTGLVHVSGVRPDGRAREALRDSDRIHAGGADRLDSIGQLHALLAGGYAGAVSLEPFAIEVLDLPDPEPAIRASLDALRAALSA
ncbi:MAG: TIM barrel protein [Rubellimicrobium sp.]|nr:TIM barrel protein [Rubellimicrobium sp.]